MTTVVVAGVAVESPIWGTSGDDVLRVYDYRVPACNPDIDYTGFRMFGCGGNDALYGGTALT